MTGSGKIIRSSTIGCFSSQRGSPGVAGRAVVAGRDVLDPLALVRVHLQQTPDALALLPRRVVHARAAVGLPGVHAQERQLSEQRVAQELEGGGGERPPPAGSSCCTPLFLKAAPQSIGTHLNASVPLRSALLISSGVKLVSPSR